MKKLITISYLFLILIICSCSDSKVQNNIKMYSETWDKIINEGNIDLIDNSRFTEDITLVSSPENVVGIENFKDYYNNFLIGFSDIEFDLVDIFGQDDKLVKHWHFKGTHSGNFFGIPATGKKVDVEGVTLVKMEDGKIAQEQDFMDNLAFMAQLDIDPFLDPGNSMIVRKIYEDFAKGDIESVGAVMDENLVWNEAENFPYADKNPYKGFNAVVEGVFGRIMSEWDNWTLTDLTLHEMTNGKILATGRYNATFKSNKAPLDLQMAHLWTIQNGKVIGFQQFADTKGIAEVMSK